MGDVWRLVRCGEDGRVIVLDSENVVVGRNVEFKYRVEANNISRQHARFTTSSNGTLQVSDLRSYNGVFVNGAKITPSIPVPLQEGDCIGFGKPYPLGADVFVFTLRKDSAPVAPTNGLPDASVSVNLLSDDDDVVVTEVIPPKRHRAASARSSSLENAARSPLSSAVAKNAFPTVKLKKEPSESGRNLSVSRASADQFSASSDVPKTDRAGVLHAGIPKTDRAGVLHAGIPKTDRAGVLYAGIPKTDRAGVLHANSTPVREQMPDTMPTTSALGTERHGGLGTKVKTEKNAWDLSDACSTTSCSTTLSTLGSPALPPPPLNIEPVTVKTEKNDWDLRNTSSVIGACTTLGTLGSPVSSRPEPITTNGSLQCHAVSETHQGNSALAQLFAAVRGESAHSAQGGQISGEVTQNPAPEKVNVLGAVPGGVPKNIKGDSEMPVLNDMSRLSIYNNQSKVSCDVPTQSSLGRRFESVGCVATLTRNDEAQGVPQQRVESRVEHGSCFKSSVQLKTVPRKYAANISVKKEPVFANSRDSSSPSDLATTAEEGEETSVQEAPLQSAQAPEVGAASISVKVEPVLCGSSNMLCNPGMSDMPKEVSSVAVAKKAQGGFTAGTSFRCDGPKEVSSASVPKKAQGDLTAGNSFREIDSRAKKYPASKKNTDYCLSVLVKPCSVVLEKLECVLVEGHVQSPVDKNESSSEGDEADQDDIEHDEVESASDNLDALHDDGNHDVQFSQKDIIIVLSDSEDEASDVIDFQFKKEPEEVEESIRNDADVDDNMPFAVSCLDDLPEEGKVESIPPLAEDKELEKRLVWNDPEPEKFADQDQPVDFFPELSQSFFDSPVPAKKIKTSGTLVDRNSILPSSSISCRPNNTDRRQPRSPKKKGNLREKLMKSMKHRVPMAGGGSAVQKKSGEIVEKSSLGAAGKESSKKPHYKERFQSRTVHLLNTQESLDAATSTLRKKQSRSIKPLSSAQSLQKGVGTSVSSGAAAETVRPSNLPLRQDTPVSVAANPAETESVRNEERFTVPAFKHSVRISRAAKRSSCDSAVDVRVEGKAPVALPVDRSTCDSAVVPRVENEVRVAPPFGPDDQLPEPMDIDVIERKTPEPMDIDVTERKTRVRFHIEHPSVKTDEQRAEFAERVRASLKKRRLDQIQKCKANLDVFIMNILNWKVQWLKEQLESPVLPPVVDMDKFRNKRFMYSNLEEYKMVNFYFLCVEVWQIVFRNWCEFFARTSRMTYSSAVTDHLIVPGGDIMILTCVVVATQQQMQKSMYPIEGHLVRLDLRIRDKRSAAMPVFGFVMEHKFVKDSHTHQRTLPKLLENTYSDGCTLITLKIQVKARPVTLDFGKLQRLSVVSKITPTLRQMEAVSLLEKTAFSQCIARPNASNFWCRTGSAMKSGIRNRFSDEQHEVISSAVAAVSTPGSEVRIVLLHGPPGTGKTHTIVGIVTELLCRNSRQTMLIVAPSNAAVDEIGRRLLAHRQWQYRLKTPPEQVLKVVRIGQDSKVHPEVRGVCLEELLQKNIQKEGNERLRDFEQSIAYTEHEMKKCADKMTKIKRDSCPDEKLLRRLEFESNHLKAQLQQTREKKRAFENTGRQSRSIPERKLAILRGAHVVLSTLNSCRSRLMEEAFGRSSGRTFSCVLVDEATQCTEVESLLCLQYPNSKLILVGDPMQLPATVISQDAVERGFQESLFERFYNYLNLEADPKPIFTLNEQRRMHSEICLFPSRNFYGGKLRPIAGLDAKYASFPLTPYLIFNIGDSPEEASESSSTSWLNRGEAAFVARLCHAIYKLAGPDVSLGVITPYQAQKTAIMEQLQENLPRWAAAVDVNTVDGFQGQERDVIVLSCVRAHHPKGSIGFVADARRLNVAITRARKALFICGHLDSLKDTEEWCALISDAHERCKVQDISASCSSNLVSDIIRKK